MTQTSVSAQRQALRQQLRQLRRSLSPAEQHYGAEQLCLQLSRHHRIRTATSIAVYLPNDGEISPLPFIHWAAQQGKRLYLPVLNPIKPGHLWFVEYRYDSPMQTNRFGILEPNPRYNAILPTWGLDIVLLPLVGFDPKGGRLGMGGGYYDRTFANRQRMAPFNRPKLIGLAHQRQQVEQLPIASWDIPLAAIATDETLIYC